MITSLTNSTCLQCFQFANQIHVIKKDFKIKFDALINDNNILKFQIEKLLSCNEETVNYEKEKSELKQQIDLLFKTNENHVREIQQLKSQQIDAKSICSTCNKSFKELQDKVLQSIINKHDLENKSDIKTSINPNLEAVYKSHISLETAVNRERKWSDAILKKYQDLLVDEKSLKDENDKLKTEIESLRKKLKDFKQLNSSQAASQPIISDDKKITNKTKEILENKVKNNYALKGKKFKAILKKIPSIPTEKFEFLKTDNISQIYEDVIKEDIANWDVSSVHSKQSTKKTNKSSEIAENQYIDDFDIDNVDFMAGENDLKTQNKDSVVSDISSLSDLSKSNENEINDVNCNRKPIKQQKNNKNNNLKKINNKNNNLKKINNKSNNLKKINNKNNLIKNENKKSEKTNNIDSNDFGNLTEVSEVEKECYTLHTDIELDFNPCDIDFNIENQFDMIKIVNNEATCVSDDKLINENILSDKPPENIYKLQTDIELDLNNCDINSFDYIDFLVENNDHTENNDFSAAKIVDKTEDSGIISVDSLSIVDKLPCEKFQSYCVVEESYNVEEKTTRRGYRDSVDLDASVFEPEDDEIYGLKTKMEESESVAEEVQLNEYNNSGAQENLFPHLKRKNLLNENNSESDIKKIRIESERESRDKHDNIDFIESSPNITKQQIEENFEQQNIETVEKEKSEIVENERVIKKSDDKTVEIEEMIEEIEDIPEESVLSSSYIDKDDKSDLEDEKLVISGESIQLVKSGDLISFEDDSFSSKVNKKSLKDKTKSNIDFNKNKSNILKNTVISLESEEKLKSINYSKNIDKESLKIVKKNDIEKENGAEKSLYMDKSTPLRNSCVEINNESIGEKTRTKSIENRPNIIKNVNIGEKLKTKFDANENQLNTIKNVNIELDNDKNFKKSLKQKEIDFIKIKDKNREEKLKGFDLNIEEESLLKAIDENQLVDNALTIDSSPKVVNEESLINNQTDNLVIDENKEKAIRLLRRQCFLSSDDSSTELDDNLDEKIVLNKEIEENNLSRNNNNFSSEKSMDCVSLKSKEITKERKIGILKENKAKTNLKRKESFNLMKNNEDIKSKKCKNDEFVDLSDWSMNCMTDFELPITVDFDLLGSSGNRNTEKKSAHLEFLRKCSKCSPENIKQYKKTSSFINTNKTILNELEYNKPVQKDDVCFVVQQHYFLNLLNVRRINSKKESNSTNVRMDSFIKNTLDRNRINENEISHFLDRFPRHESIFDQFCICVNNAIRKIKNQSKKSEIVKKSIYLIVKSMRMFCGTERALTIFIHRALQSLVKTELVNIDYLSVQLAVFFGVFQSFGAADRIVCFLSDICLCTNVPLIFIISAIDSLENFVDYSVVDDGDWFLKFLRLLFQSEYRQGTLWCVSPNISEVGWRFWSHGIDSFRQDELFSILRDVLQHQGSESVNFIGRLFSIVKKRCVK